LVLAFGAEAAVEADVFVTDHDTAKGDYKSSAPIKMDHENTSKLATFTGTQTFIHRFDSDRPLRSTKQLRVTTINRKSYRPSWTNFNGNSPGVYDASKTDLVFSRSGNISPKFYRILREACEPAGVPYGRKNPDGLVLHDARHTATTHLLESNVSPKTVQEWMGWSDKAFVLYYSHASKESREAAGKSLEKLAGEKIA